MKKFSILCIVVLLLSLMTVPSIAQHYEVDIHPPDGTFDTEINVTPGSQFCFDVYLTSATMGEPTAGGVFIDYTGSTGLVSYVSATDAVPLWELAISVDEPEGAGTFWTKL